MTTSSSFFLNHTVFTIIKLGSIHVIDIVSNLTISLLNKISVITQLTNSYIKYIKKTKKDVTSILHANPSLTFILLYSRSNSKTDFLEIFLQTT